MKKYIVNFLGVCFFVGCIDLPLEETSWIDKSEIIWNKTYNLSSGQYVTIYDFSLPLDYLEYKNIQYEIYFEELTGIGADFYVLDSINFNSFENEEDVFYVYLAKKDRLEFSAFLDVPNETHFMIVSNRYSYDSVIVNIKITLHWKEKI